MGKECTPKTTIIIPTEVDASRCYGDIESGVRFEINPGQFPDELGVIKEAFARGERVFVTESDNYMFLRPETLPGPETG